MFVKQFMVKAILVYKRYISPMKGTKCPYFPSCSDYGLEAVKTHGAFKGSALLLWRLLRCNPFSHGGYDPVPVKMRKRFRKNSETPKGGIRSKCF